MDLREVFLALGFAACLGLITADRTIVPAINPGCPETNHCEDTGDARFWRNMVYVVSRDQHHNETADYRMYWSFIGAPTFLITQVPAETKKDETGITGWPEFVDGRPQMPFLDLGNKSFVGVTLMKLIEFEDEKNTGKVEDATNTTVYNFGDDSRWYNVSLTYSSDGSLLGVFTGSFAEMDYASNITVEVRAHPATLREDIPPKMQLESSSFTVRVVLNNFTVHSEKSRFAVEVIYGSHDSANQTATHASDKSISDEFTPGVFTVEKVSTQNTFMLWRPVVYTSAKPGVSDSTRSSTSSLRNITIDYRHNATEGGVPYSLLLGLANDSVQLTHFNVSLGQTDDDYYGSSAFQEWSFMVGLGQPLVDPVSSKIRLIIGIGFGLPAALIIIGGSYVAYKKIQKRRQERSLLVGNAAPTYESLG